ncbi:hypothetical protein EBT31_07450 [bacterium]|nr:hypothetical protein [bacterium]NBX48476.1 hypothetical protein [bacterium]
MASATFEEHPTEPDKMIMRKPRLDQGADYERGFVDGMQYQMQTSVDKAVNAMSRTWVGLTDDERNDCLVSADPCEALAKSEAEQLMEDIEAKLKEKNNDVF